MVNVLYWAMFRKTDPQRNLFGVETNMPSSLPKTAIDRLCICVSEQRVDSTHIQSNIHSKGCLALFMDVITTVQNELSRCTQSHVIPANAGIQL